MVRSCAWRRCGGGRLLLLALDGSDWQLTPGAGSPAFMALAHGRSWGLLAWACTQARQDGSLRRAASPWPRVTMPPSLPSPYRRSPPTQSPRRRRSPSRCPARALQHHQSIHGLGTFVVRATPGKASLGGTLLPRLRRAAAARHRRQDARDQLLADTWVGGLEHDRELQRIVKAFVRRSRSRVAGMR